MAIAWAVRVIRRFAGDRRGNFAIMVAVAVIPMLGGIGLAVDYANLLRQKTRLANAADAAVLAAISENSPGRAYGDDMPGGGAVPVAEADAENFFRADFIDSDVELTSVVSDVKRRSNRYTSTLRYEAQVPITFGKFLNMETVTVAGEAQAQIGIDPASDFYLLLDNTPSMGVGATPVDIATMVANTGDQCAFACHSLDNPSNNYTLAKSLGVAMRIDVVRLATQQLTDTAKATSRYAKQFRMAVYSFGEAATARKLTEVAGLTADMGDVKSASADLDLMTIPYQNYDNDQLTSFDAVLSSLNELIPDPGTGYEGSEPQKVLFFVSDGVGDSYKPGDCQKRTTGGRCQEPINPQACEAIKERGIKIAVLYTSYLPLPTNGWYNTWIKPFQSEIGTRMKECATPGLFFEVSPSEGIADAMKALFKKSITTLRLSS